MAPDPEQERRGVFFDRDGIVNTSPGEGCYVQRWEDFHLQPDFVPVLRLVRERGYEALVVTNQRGVALGLMDAAAVEDIHRRLRRLLRATHGLTFLDILYCPHDREACDCRKPQPGMLLEAARRHGLDLGRSWMVGDSDTDMEAGRRAGCRTILVGREAAGAGPDYRVADLKELRALLAALL
jgi:D-glycero-D-manno-heptose 1,7-bisphosphate phosphatase